MTDKNVKSDFELRLLDVNGAAIQFTKMNWVAKFKTEVNGAANIATYTASYIDGVFTNAYERDGEIFIVFDNHGLSAGRLTVEFTVDIPNADFPDGYQRIVQPYPLDVMLVKHATETPKTLDVTVMLPYIYRTAYDDAVAAGYDGTYSDYVQLISTLPQLTATANAAAEVAQQIAAAETERVSAENARIITEGNRVSAEEQREAAETERVQADEQRAADVQAAIERTDAAIEKNDTATKEAIERTDAAAKNANDAADAAAAQMKDIDADVQAKLKEVQQSNADIQSEIDTLVNGNASTAIESFTEVTNFLAGIEDTQTLDGIVGGIGKSIDANAKEIASNADAIEDVKNSLSDEETRAKDAEKAVADDLAAEVTRATEAEGVNADAIKVNADTIALLQKSVDNNKADIDALLKDLGYYGEIAAEELELEADESGYAVNTSGEKITKSGYAISKPIALTQGNLYLFKAEAVDKDVSMFARKSIESRTDHISYTYTYNTDGQPLTATADYDSSIVYVYNYKLVEDTTSSTDTDGEAAALSDSTSHYELESITLNGVVVTELPSERTYNVEIFTALFKTGAIATPKSGYYVYFCPTSMSILVSAKASDMVLSNTDANKGKMFGVRYGIFASIASNYVNRWERDELDERITALEKIHESDNYSQADYCVGAWKDGDLSPDSIKTYGDEQFLYDVYKKVLIDTTDNTGVTTTPVGVLKDDNLFRFEDGTFAPAVCISADDYADSTLALYRLVNGEFEQYCDEGAYSAESYLEDVLRPTVVKSPNNLAAAQLYKLVDGEFVEAHALLPWETTETKYSHGLANMRTLYLLDNVVGNSGYRWKGVFAYPAVWDGIDTTPYKLAPTAMCLSPICTVGGNARSFFYLFKGESSCAGRNGLSSAFTMFNNSRTYPRVNDVSQITLLDFVRSNNADAEAPYPCAEGGYHSSNTLLTAIEVANHTNYVFKNTRYGTGISSNDSCGSESTYLLNGGTRYRVKGTDTWKYATWGTNTDIYYADGKRATMSETINYMYPKEQCEESQIAHSWLTEFGIANNAHFSMYGGEYWVIPNAEAVSSKMNARVYKKMSQTASAYNASSEATDYEIEIVLRMSLYNGVNLSGDVYVYYGGGLEVIGACINTSTYGQPMKVYAEFDQTKWLYDKDVTHATGAEFTCQSKYRFLGEYTSLNNGYTARRLSYSPCKVKAASSIAQGECMYQYSTNGYSSKIGSLARVGARSRLNAYNAYCAPRSSYLIHSVSYSYRSAAGSAQFLINVS
jgi:hypothetical protein